MSEDFQSFLKSNMAKKVQLDSAVVLQRTRLSPLDVKTIMRDKGYHISSLDRLCELEIDGRTIARGKIVRKPKGYFFKVLELVQERS